MPLLTTDALDIAYLDAGPRDGPVVLLIHGWPDDASTWDAVVPRLHDAGLRTIVPTLRGFGQSRLRDGVPRTGNSAILAIDMIARVRLFPGEERRRRALVRSHPRQAGLVLAGSINASRRILANGLRV